MASYREYAKKFEEWKRFGHIKSIFFSSLLIGIAISDEGDVVGDGTISVLKNNLFQI